MSSSSILIWTDARIDLEDVRSTRHVLATRFFLFLTFQKSWWLFALLQQLENQRTWIKVSKHQSRFLTNCVRPAKGTFFCVNEWTEGKERPRWSQRHHTQQKVSRFDPDSDDAVRRSRLHRLSYSLGPRVLNVFCACVWSRSLESALENADPGRGFFACSFSVFFPTGLCDRTWTELRSKGGGSDPADSPASPSRCEKARGRRGSNLLLSLGNTFNT